MFGYALPSDCILWMLPGRVRLMGRDFPSPHTSISYTNILSQYFHSAWRSASIHTKGFHVEIVEALKKKDTDRAALFLEEDIRSIKDEILKLHT